ncbi:hypothetical protein [Paenibacillus marinisediminis]
MENWDYNKPWFHGSPSILNELLEGSTISQDRDLARIFSHKPSLVVVDDSGTRYHNGKANGYLYVIDDTITPNDVYPHPKTSMNPGEEWLISRPLKVKKIAETKPILEEQLSIEDEENLKKRLNK